MSASLPAQPTALPALVVFDLAGTTVKDGGEVPAAYEAALARHGIVPSAEEIHAVRGSSKREAIAALIAARAGQADARRAASAYADFKTELERRYAAGVRAIPGADECFRALRNRGVKLALNTGFDRDIARLLLRALGWEHGIADAVVCGDEVAYGRPAPDMILRAMELSDVRDPARVANVGDTLLDLQAAANAGTGWSIAVLSGAHRREQLQAAPHTHIIASVAELLPIFTDPSGS